MPSFKDITVVSIHGNGGIDASICALERTARALEGSQRLLITNIPSTADIPQRICGRLGYLEYSQFVVYCLASFIDTEYALIVQDDGWALDAKNWRDEWFSYDYIGAPTPSALHHDTWYKQYGWENLPQDELLIVQNGGFSLRSRALMEAPTKHGVVMRPHLFRYAENLLNEDVQLCCFMRKELEAHGLRFAPMQEARLFAFEHLAPIFHEDLDLRKVFGHHSKSRKLRPNNRVECFLSKAQIEQYYGEERIAELFQGYGYDMVYAE